jgi:AraC-like DNA-binding protein
MRHLELIANWIRLAEAACFSPRQLASLCSVTDRHLRRWFRYSTGAPTLHWLAEVQLWATIPLLFNRQSMKEISAQLGFGNPARFSTRFHRRFGACPSTFLQDTRAIRRALAQAGDHSTAADHGPGGTLAHFQADVRVQLNRRLDAVAPGIVRATRRRRKAE